MLDQCPSGQEHVEVTVAYGGISEVTKAKEVVSRQL